MIFRFFISLITLWLPNEKRQSVCAEAIAFLWWCRQLKLVAFLPGQHSLDIEARLKKIAVAVRKMPALSPEFFKALSEIEADKRASFPDKDWRLIVAKKDNVNSLTRFLKNISNNHDVHLLRTMLLEAEDAATTWKIKNRKMR